MRLHALLEEAGVPIPAGVGNPEIQGVVCDSRKARPGFLFVAVPGHRQDGRKYARDAVERGAVAVVEPAEAQADRVEKPAEPGGRRKAAPRIPVAHVRRTLALLSAAFHRHPSHALRMVGITGTNGKTTTAYLVRDVLREAGLSPGMLGTIEYKIGARSIPAARTTPEAPALQGLLAEMVAVGCKSAVMEVSSHALAQRRTAGIEFDIGVFTNLTRDHLDYHGNMESYYKIKRRLFLERGQCDAAAVAVINRDDPWGRRLIEERSPRATVLSYGMDAGADLRAENVRTSVSGTAFSVHTPWGAARIRTPLIGLYNVHNTLAALACACTLGVPLEEAVAALRRTRPVPGRMERIKVKSGARVFVDYAHTDNALECALRTLRALAEKRVIVVFGCGGDRDRSKRPAMGRVASLHADRTVLTSDNPRSEDPRSIIHEIHAGFEPNAPCEIIVDRARAIEHALRLAGKGDVVLIAGKGHETFQEFANVTVSFDDRRMVERFK